MLTGRIKFGLIVEFRGQNGRFDDCVVKLRCLVIRVACRIRKIELLSCVNSNIRENYCNVLENNILFVLYRDDVFKCCILFFRESGHFSGIMFTF